MFWLDGHEDPARQQRRRISFQVARGCFLRNHRQIVYHT
jgi:hypothetical protein